MAENAGAALLGGISAGQGIRGRYDSFKQGKELQDASRSYFEKLRSLGGETVAPDSALPVPDSGGSEGMVANAAAATNAPAAALPVDGGPLPAKKKKTYRSTTADDYTELDTMAAKIATMTGDAKTYEALRGMTRSHVQTRIMDQMRKAQVALQVGDQDGLEDAIQRAYQYVPDAQELKMKRDKDGQLMFRHPASGQELPVNAESLRLFAMAALDPDAMEETLYGRKKVDTEQKQKDRALDVDEANSKTSARNADATMMNAQTAAKNAAETARSNKVEEARKEEDAKAQRLRDRAAAVQSLTYADYLNRDKGKAGANGGLKPSDMRNYSKDINESVRSYVMPTEKQVTTDEYGAQKVIDAPAARLPGFENADEGTINAVSSFAEQIGIANPTLGISHAVNAGATIYQALQGKGDINVDPAQGLLGVPVNGRMQVFRVPPEMIQTLMMRSKQAQAPAPALPAK